MFENLNSRGISGICLLKTTRMSVCSIGHLVFSALEGTLKDFNRTVLSKTPF